MFSISYKTSFHENAFYFLQLILVSEIHEKSTESIVNQLINRNILACSYSQTIVQILWMSEYEKESHIQNANSIMNKMNLKYEWIDDQSNTSLHLLGL